MKAMECRPCTSDTFKRITQAPATIDTIQKVRNELALGHIKEARAIKSTLPGFLYQTKEVLPSTDDKKYNKGKRGRWRLQNQCILNGLVMCDFDHVKNPRERFKEITSRVDLKELGVCLMFITPGGEGLKSNNRFYHHAENNVETGYNGEEWFLHQYMFSTELLSLVNAKGGFQEKRDIILQSFHNERNGVDYASTDSVNSSMPMMFSGVFTCTRTSLQQFINARNIGDGMSTRFTSWLMPEDDYHTDEYRSTRRDYTLLPEEFTTKDVMRVWGYSSNTTASNKCSKLERDRIIMKLGRGKYRKLATTI